MPDDVSCRVRFQVESADHYFTLLKVFSNSKGEQVLVDLTLKVELLDKERSSLTASYRGEAYDAVTRHTRQSLLVCSRDESHIFGTLVRFSTQTDLILSSIAPYVSTAITYLA